MTNYATIFVHHKHFQYHNTDLLRQSMDGNHSLQLWSIRVKNLINFPQLVYMIRNTDIFSTYLPQRHFYIILNWYQESVSSNTLINYMYCEKLLTRNLKYGAL